LPTACARKADIRGVDIDGCVQHLIHKVFVSTDFSKQPNVNVPAMLEKNFQTVDKAITFSNFSVEKASHQDASRYADRPDVDDDDSSNGDYIDKAVFRAKRDDHGNETPEEKLCSGIILDPAHQDADPEPADTAQPHEQTTAARRARQTAEECRAINLKHRLLDGLQATPEHERDATISAIAAHLAQHSEPLLLTLLENDVTSKSKKNLDPLVVKLAQAVAKAVRFADVEALLSHPRKKSDDQELDSMLVLTAGRSAEEIKARAEAIMSRLSYLDGCDTAQHTRDKLQTRAVNKCGKFPADIQQAATLLLAATQKKGPK
jgi:hypothetical protein